MIKAALYNVAVVAGGGLLALAAASAVSYRPTKEIYATSTCIKFADGGYMQSLGASIMREAPWWERLWHKPQEPWMKGAHPLYYRSHMHSKCQWVRSKLTLDQYEAEAGKPTFFGGSHQNADGSITMPPLSSVSIPVMEQLE